LEGKIPKQWRSSGIDRIFSIDHASGGEQVSLDAKIPPDEEYLHIRVTGQEPFEDIRRQVMRGSRHNAVVRILCETDSKGTEPLHVLHCLKECVSITFPRYVRLSMVCPKESFRDVQFTEAIIEDHKGLFLGVFTDREKARAWLMKES